MKFESLIACGLALFALTACDRKPAPPAPPPPAGTPAPKPGEGSGTPAPKETPPPDDLKVPHDEIDPLTGLKEVASLPDEFYGKWKLKGSSGGMGGGGEGKPVPDETLVITKENKVETWKNGKLESTVAFRIGRGKSIFGNDNWHIARGGFPDVISVREGKELTISENHPDGFNWHYEKVQ